MKKFITISLLLLAALTTSFGQRRTYLEQSIYGHNIFVVEEGGSPVVYMQFRPLFSQRDSVFLVITEHNCQSIHDYFSKAQKVFVKWERLARVNKVKEYQKELDIERPSATIMWRTMRAQEWDWRPSASLPRLSETSGYRTMFEVDKDGGAHVRVHFYLEDDFEPIMTLGSKNAIDELVLKLNWSRLMREYKKRLPRNTNEELDQIFIQ